MSCNYFRVFLTLLVAFGAFFAYLCRLNLSLVIEEMCVKELVRNPAAPNVDNVPEVETNRFELARSLSEEQTFAELSTGNWWIKQRALLHKVKLKPKRVANRNSSKSWRPPTPMGVHAFSIEFDVRNHNKPGGGNSPIKVATNENGPHSNQPDQNVIIEDTPQPPEETTEPVPQDSSALLNWNKENRNKLLGAFFLGYVIFQVPAGRAAELFGPKLLLLWLGLGTGLSSLVFPYAARFSGDSIWFPYTIRVVMGASQAALFPATYVILCNWLPKNERSSWLAVPSAMGRFGTIAMNLLVPIIMGQEKNWEWVFYASGLVTVAWSLLVLLLSSDRPSTSRWLSRQELVYIESRMEPPTDASAASPVGLPTLDGSTLSLDGKRPMKVAKPSIDWLKMLRNRAMLILTVVMFSSEWSNMLLLVKLPGFLGPALNMGLGEIGTFSSCLVLIYCVMYPLAGVLASQLEACHLSWMDSLRVRKLFEAMAQMLQAAGCFVIAIYGNKVVVLSALVAMMLGRSLVGGGQCLMPPELSKDYPGTVMALANSLANLAGLLGPELLNYLVKDPTSYGDWRNMWLLSGSLFVVCGILFCCLADNRPQNYCKKPKLKRSQTTSLANLVLPAYLPPPLDLPKDDDKQEQATGAKRRGLPSESSSGPAEEIIRMGSFSRISSEPQPTRAQRRQRQHQRQQQQPPPPPQIQQQEQQTKIE